MCVASHVRTWAAGETAVRVAGVTLVAVCWVDLEVASCKKRLKNCMRHTVWLIV